MSRTLDSIRASQSRLEERLGVPAETINMHPGTLDLIEKEVLLEGAQKERDRIVALGIEWLDKMPLRSNTLIRFLEEIQKAP